MKNSTQTIDQVLNAFEGFRMAPTNIDQYAAVGRQVLANKISGFINAGKTIDFVMLGYPMKSANMRDKVLGKLPDMAEEVSLLNFKTFNRAVQQVYEPGVKIHIVNDGFVFNDLLKVEDKTVEQYAEVTVEYGKPAPMAWYNLRDFYNTDLQTGREKLMAQFGITVVELEQRILFDPNVNSLYRGMVHFMEEELAVNNYTSKNQLHKAAKQLAREMMLRNEAYSGLVKKYFASHIRLSMHPSTNAGEKYSFQLIPGAAEKIRHSPWHSVLLVDRFDQYATIHRKDAEAKPYKYQLVNVGGRPSFYKEY